MRRKTIASTSTTTFGANLRRARQAAKLKLRDVAKRLRINTIAPLSMWERSSKVPGPETIIKLAAAVGTSPAALLKNVVTPYDALRGHGVVIDASLAAQLPGLVTGRERQLLDAWRAANPTLKRLITTMLRELGPALAHTGVAPPVAPSSGAARRRVVVPASSAAGAASPVAPTGTATDRVVRRALAR